jgi:hypothetical protein
VKVSALSEKGKAPLTKHQGDSLATQIKGVPRAAAFALALAVIWIVFLQL